MADPNRDPRTTVNVTDRSRRTGGSALWLVLGALLVALVLYFLVFAGADVADTAAEDGTVIVNDGATTVVEGAEDAAEGTAAAVDGAAEAVEETAEDAAEATEEAVDGDATVTTTTPGN